MAAEDELQSLVLIVEDDEDSRYVYTAILEDNGFQVATASSGDDGLRIARERRPHAILLDVSIPGMDGWSVSSHLKAEPDTAGIPLIIITAHAFPEDAQRASEVGCDAFLTKPCEPRQVLNEVTRLLERARAASEAPEAQGPEADEAGKAR
jgi:two-component system, cell cycle response regulator DivK